MPISDRGLGHLTAALRCTAGLKGGRYVFEVRVLEMRPGKG